MSDHPLSAADQTWLAQSYDVSVTFDPSARVYRCETGEGHLSVDIPASDIGSKPRTTVLNRLGIDPIGFTE